MSNHIIDLLLPADGPSNPEQELLFQKAGLQHREAILDLLITNKLPVNDLAEGVPLWVLMHEDQVAGTAGLEQWGEWALLRSVCIADRGKGRGWGKLISREMEAVARQAGVKQLYLLTTTAEGFFEKLGYLKTDRDAVPEVVRQSGQFKGICPASATVMIKRL